MLLAILNKSGRQHPTRHQLYGHLPPITKTIQVRRTRHAGHCWRSRDELISDVLLWTPTHDLAKAGRPARTYIQQLCEDTRCCPEDLPRAIKDREKWRERVRDIRASGTTWWWWWWSWWCYYYIIIIILLLYYYYSQFSVDRISDYAVPDYVLIGASLLNLVVITCSIFFFIIITSLEFLIWALADNLSLDFEWLQISSSLQDFSQYIISSSGLD